MGEGAALARDLGEAPAERRSGRWDVEAHDDIARGERRRIRIMDEIGDPLHPHAAASADPDAGVERNQAARPVRGRIGQRHAAADGAVVAHRPVGDLAGDAPHQAAENIRHLAENGWQVSSGFIAGLPGETVADLLANLKLANDLPLSGCSVSPFIPGDETPLSAARTGDIDLALNCMAAMRLMRPDWVIPIVSALNLAGAGTGLNPKAFVP